MYIERVANYAIAKIKMIFINDIHLRCSYKLQNAKHWFFDISIQ